MRSKLAERLSAPGIRFKALPWGSRIALLFLIMIVLSAVFAPVIAPHDPLETFIPATPPGAEHFFGTDRLGRDIFSRLLFGAQSSLMIGLGAVILAILAGSLLGSFAATSSKAVNELIMRLMDILMAFPGIALAAVLLAAFGNSVPTIIIAIAIIYTPQLARVVRANVLSQYGEDYVRAERVIGAGRFYIVPYSGKASGDVNYVSAGVTTQGIMPLYQRCVHLGCRVPFCVSSKWFECPCHGSKYNEAGEYQLGPAPRGMDRFKITIDSSGNVLVDTSQIILGPARGTNTIHEPAQGPFCVAPS